MVSNKIVVETGLVHGLIAKERRANVPPAHHGRRRQPGLYSSRTFLFNIREKTICKEMARLQNNMSPLTWLWPFKMSVSHFFTLISTERKPFTIVPPNLHVKPTNRKTRRKLGKKIINKINYTKTDTWIACSILSRTELKCVHTFAPPPAVSRLCTNNLITHVLVADKRGIMNFDQWPDSATVLLDKINKHTKEIKIQTLCKCAYS